VVALFLFVLVDVFGDDDDDDVDGKLKDTLLDIQRKVCADERLQLFCREKDLCLKGSRLFPPTGSAHAQRRALSSFSLFVTCLVCLLLVLTLYDSRKSPF